MINKITQDIEEHTIIEQSEKLVEQMDELFEGEDPAAIMVALIQMTAEMGTGGYFKSNKYEFIGRVVVHLSEAYDEELEAQAAGEPLQ